jgi:hypothetical protein
MESFNVVEESWAKNGSFGEHSEPFFSGSLFLEGFLFGILWEFLG